MNEKASPWVLAARVLFTAALAGTIAFIFSNSMQIASASQAASGRVLDLLRSLLRHAGLPGLAVYLTDHIVRKAAHFLEYALAGFWLMLCLRAYTRRIVRHISWPVLGGLLTALTDETIQLFSQGRSSQLTDVWLDFSGVLAGIFAGLVLLALVHACAEALRHRK